MNRRQNLRDQYFVDNNIAGINDIDDNLENIDFSMFLDDSVTPDVNLSETACTADMLDFSNIPLAADNCPDNIEELLAAEINDITAPPENVLDFDEIYAAVPSSDEIIFNSLQNDFRNEVSAIQQSGTGNIINFARIGETSHEYNKYFKKHEFVSEYRVNHSLRTRADLFKFEQEVDLFFHSLILEYVNNEEYRQRNDLISIEIFEPSMRNRIYVPPFRVNSFNLEDFLNTLMVLSQSNTEFLLTGTFQVIVRVVENTVGGARKRKAPEDVRDRHRKKRCIVEIITRNSDAGSCGFRALFVGKYLADNGKTNVRDWQRVVKDSLLYQTNGAKEIANLCGFEWTRRIDVLDLRVIQEKLPEYQIRMIDAATREILFAGPIKEKEITIIHSDAGEGHYDHCSSITAFLEKKYFCKYCNTGYDQRIFHMCEFTCERCFHQPKCGIQQNIVCAQCHREFYGSQCFDKHKENVCSQKKKCNLCLVEHTKKHNCNKIICSKCNEEYTTFPHYCFLRPLDISKLNEEDSVHKSIVIYDIETVQVSENNVIKHKPNLVVCVTVCKACYDFNSKEKLCADCSHCGKTFTSFFGFDCVQKFCDYIYKEVAQTAAQQNGNVILFAHNARGFDGHFVLKDMFSRKFVQQPNIIMTGNKILKMEIGNCKFIDSLSFFQMPLDSLPKAFGLNSFKGHFPHNFNRVENYNYNGELPQINEYGIKYLLPKKAKELSDWHNQELVRMREQNLTFNFKNELLQYCTMDVKVLLQAVMEFSKLMKEITDIDPYTRCFTLASLAMEVFRAKFLKEKTIGISPLNGYRDSRNASKSATAWILALEKLERINNPSFKIHREQKFGNLYVDGVCHETKTIYEFYGCYWHGCDKCYSNRMHELGRNGRTHQENFNDISTRNTYLESFRYTIVSSSDCKLKTLLRENSVFKKEYSFFRNRLSEIEKVGDATVEVRGGRTQNICFYYKAQENEEIKYFDFTSLYPYVCAKKRLPLGHPDIILPEDNDISRYYGFIKCAVIPPKQLHIPVLPNKVRNKLLFPLCVICARDMIQDSCPHSDDERTITDTWYSVELNRALTKGYVMKKVYVVNDYKLSATNLFEEYVNLFGKIKQEASGFPDSVVTDEQKQRFCEYYYQFTNILLNILRICSNPALRTLAKLLLNTIWGKFAEQLNKAQTSLCTEYFDYWTLLNDETKSIIGEAEVSERVMLVKYKEKVPQETRSRKSNFPLAAAVTGNARDVLYEEIDKIESVREGRVLYMDTDSIIFTKRDGEYEPLLGDFMGQMTDEVTKDYGAGAKITEFVSNGPKNYGYRIQLPNGDSKYCLKVKGIRINTEAADMITFERMVAIAIAYMNGEKIETRIPQFVIGSDLHQNIYTNYFYKIYRAVTDKRKIVTNSVFTKPYGYVN